MKKSEPVVQGTVAQVKLNVEEEVLEAIQELGKLLIAKHNLPSVSDMEAGVEMGPEPFTLTVTVAPAETIH